MKRTASAQWRGDLKSGKGTVSTSSGSSRQCGILVPDALRGWKGTNPEELLAAAHAGCFSMALSAQWPRQTSRPKASTHLRDFARKTARWIRHNRKPPGCEAAHPRRHARGLRPSRTKCQNRLPRLQALQNEHHPNRATPIRADESVPRPPFAPRGKIRLSAMPSRIVSRPLVPNHTRASTCSTALRYAHLRCCAALSLRVFSQSSLPLRT